MEFTIRRAVPEDVGLLTELRLEMRREREQTELSVSEAEFRARTLDYFRRSLSDGSFVSFLAFSGDRAAACSGLLLREVPPTYGNPEGKTAMITNMFTRPDFRHQGLAVKLLDCLAEFARTAGCRKLQLNASPMGRGVYLKYGFREISGEMEFALK